MKKAFLLLALLLSLSPKAGAAEKYAAVTFDGAPSGAAAEQLLEALEQRGAKVTFFLWGSRLAQQPDLAGQILAGRHEIGIQGFSREDMRQMSRRTIARELMDTQALLPQRCHVRFFRPPDGLLSDGVVQVAKARGLAIALWSVDPRDRGGQGIRHTSDGDVVVMHDLSESSIRSAIRMIDRLRAQGFRFVTLSELARLHKVRIRSGQIYRCFPPPEKIK